MDLEHRDQCSLQVVWLWLFGVVDLNWMLSPLQVQHRWLVEVLGEQVYIHGGRHYYDLCKEMGYKEKLGAAFFF